MNRAEELFDRLKHGGLGAIEDLLADAQPESLFLDFKRSHRDGVGRTLEDSDNKNLSKGISGFANAEGGVLIWGIDCRRNEDGIEVTQKHALVDAGGFRTKIEGAISRATVPPHAKIETIHILDESGTGAGYVVVLVPKSESGPVRSVKTSNYHVRTGSDNSIISHDVLSGMFGKSWPPKVSINIVLRECTLSERQDYITIPMGITFVNYGATTAHNMYCSFLYTGLEADQILVQETSSEIFSLRRGILPVFSVSAKQGMIVVPGAADDVCNINLKLPLGFRNRVSITCTVGAEWLRSSSSRKRGQITGSRWTTPDFSDTTKRGQSSHGGIRSKQGSE